MLSVGDRVCYDEAFLSALVDKIERAGVPTKKARIMACQESGVVLSIEGQRHTDLARVRWDSWLDSSSLVLVTSIRKETP